jgi:hypothetical protein
MTDQRSGAPKTGAGENPELRDEEDARKFAEGASASGGSTDDRGDISGLSEDDEADWEEQEALKGVSEGGDDPALDERLSDDKEG